MYFTKLQFKKEEVLNESGIKLPKGTKKVKVLLHNDTDGFFSALFAVNQLQKQGIKKEDIFLDTVGYSDKRLKEKGSSSKGKAIVIVDFAAMPKDFDKGEKGDIDKYHKPDFVSDHHDNSKGDLVAGKAGKIGTKFKSDAEHIAVSYANNIADWTTIKEISKIDSASYTRLLDTFELPKNFKESNRMERLAILTSVLLSKLFSTNEQAIFDLIKTASPSLVSVYNEARKKIKLTAKQYEGLDELKKPNPDYSKIENLQKQTPYKISKENITRYSLKEKDAEEIFKKIRERNLEDIKKAQSGSFTKENQKQLEEAKRQKKNFEEMLAEYQESQKDKKPDENNSALKNDILADVSAGYGKKLQGWISELENDIRKLEALKEKKQGQYKPLQSNDTAESKILKQDGTATRDNPSRFLGAILSKDGKRFPFLIRRFEKMFQISLNPDVDATDKEKVNLIEDMKAALEKIRKEYEGKKVAWAFDIIAKKSGGHAGISNASGFEVLNLMPKFDKMRKIDIEEKEKEAKLKKVKFEELYPNLVDERNNIKGWEKANQEARERIMDKIEKELASIIETKYKDIEVKSGKQMKDGKEVKYDIEEAFKNKVKKYLK